MNVAPRAVDLITERTHLPVASATEFLSFAAASRRERREVEPRCRAWIRHPPPPGFAPITWALAKANIAHRVASDRRTNVRTVHLGFSLLQLQHPSGVTGRH